MELRLECASRDIELSSERREGRDGLRIRVHSEYLFTGPLQALELRGPSGLTPSAVHINGQPCDESAFVCTLHEVGDGSVMKVCAVAEKGWDSLEIITEAFLPTTGQHNGVVWRGLPRSGQFATFSCTGVATKCRTRLQAHKKDYAVLLAPEEDFPCDVLSFCVGSFSPGRFHRQDPEGATVIWRGWREVRPEDSDEDDELKDFEDRVLSFGADLKNCVILGDDVYTLGEEEEQAIREECSDEVVEFFADQDLESSPASTQTHDRVRQAMRESAESGATSTRVHTHTRACVPEDADAYSEHVDACQEASVQLAQGPSVDVARVEGSVDGLGDCVVQRRGSDDDYVSSDDGEAGEAEECFYHVREVPSCPVPGSTGL